MVPNNNLEKKENGIERENFKIYFDGGKFLEFNKSDEGVYKLASENFLSEEMSFNFLGFSSHDLLEEDKLTILDSSTDDYGIYGRFFHFTYEGVEINFADQKNRIVKAASIEAIKNIFLKIKPETFDLRDR